MVSCPAWHQDIDGNDLIYQAALAEVMDEVSTYSQTTSLDTARIRKWHLKLLGSFVPSGFDYYAGHFRQIDSRRPCLNQMIGVVGPNFRGLPGVVPAHVPKLMERITKIYKEEIRKLELDWDTLTESQRIGHLAMALATFVGQFIKIHPFINGNGRVSRLVWRWGVLRYEVPPQVGIIPRPDPPYSSLMDSAMRGDFNPLAGFIIDYLAQNIPNPPVPSKN